MPKKPATVPKKRASGYKRASLAAPAEAVRDLSSTEEYANYINSNFDRGDVSVKMFFDDPNLNLYEALFLTEYIRHFNGMKAVQASAYKAERHMLSRLSATIRARPNVRRALKNYMDKLSEARDDENRLIRMELRKIAFADLSDVAEWTEDGQLRVIPSSEMDEGAKAGLESIQSVEQYSEGSLSSRRLEVKRINKLQALKMLGAMNGALCEHIRTLSSTCRT